MEGKQSSRCEGDDSDLAQPPASGIYRLFFRLPPSLSLHHTQTSMPMCLRDYYTSVLLVF